MEYATILSKAGFKVPSKYLELTANNEDNNN
jgi:hypothetical protein